MATGRRKITKVVGATTAAVGAMSVSGVATATEPTARTRTVRAFAFDAYGTLFDVFSVTALCEQLFPGQGNAVAQLWRAKQLQYSLLRAKALSRTELSCAVFVTPRVARVGLRTKSSEHHAESAAVKQFAPPSIYSA